VSEVKKQLVLFNGRAAVVYNPRDPVWWSMPDKYRVRAYVAAYSTADAVRLIEEYNGGWPRAASELRTYWSKGTWGRAMDGITPERGIWITTEFSDEKPRRLNTMNEQLEIPLKATPRTRVRLPIDPDDDIPRTAWVTKEDPPVSGYWEVTDHETGTKRERWWYEEKTAVWFTSGEARRSNALAMPAVVFRGTHAWRGLVTPSHEVYHTPPYSGLDLMNRAQQAGVAIRTTYLRATPALPAARRARL
jgi:hypothetical protein